MENVLSKEVDADYGIARGTVLCLLLFITYVNDIYRIKTCDNIFNKYR